MDSIMVMHSAQGMPKTPSHRSLTRGFEASAFPKLIRKLRDPERDTRYKALLAADDLLSVPLGLAQSISAGVAEALTELLQDDDRDCRVVAAKCMHSVVRTPRGAEAAHKAGATKKLLVSLAEPCPLIRQSAYGALLEALRHPTVRQEVAVMPVDMTLPTVREHYIAAKPARNLEVWGGVPISSVEYILGCAVQEAKECESQNGASEARQAGQPRAALALLALVALSQMRSSQPVLDKILADDQAISFISSLLTNLQPQVQLAAIKLLVKLCSVDLAKDLAVQSCCVPKLIAVATSGSQEAAVEATGALAMITSTVSGKEALLHDGDPAVLFELLAGSDSLLLQRNVLNIISNAAENPQMRTKLTDAGVMELLSGRQESASDTINRAVKTTLQQCAFEHRPVVTPCIQGSDTCA